MHTQLLLVSALITAFALMGCTSDNPHELDTTVELTDLIGTKWTLIDMDDAPPIKDSTVTIEFMPESRCVGTGGINRYFATFKRDGPSGLTFGPTGVTRMAGPPELMAQEDRFFKLLAGVATFGGSKTRLVLYTENTPVLTFAPQGE